MQRNDVTELEDVELLLRQPEIVAWLELSELDVRSWLKLLHETHDDDEGPRAA